MQTSLGSAIVLGDDFDMKVRKRVPQAAGVEDDFPMTVKRRLPSTPPLDDFELIVKRRN